MFKKSLFLLLLVLCFIGSKAQTGGFINLNDFGLPTYPYSFSRFWLRGSTPAGSNPIIEVYGLSNFKLYTDTISSTKLHLRNDGDPYKLVSISNAGMFGAFTPSYLIPADTVGKWLGVGTSIPNAQIQSDWTQVSSGAVDFIKNKPTIPAAQVNSDWNSVSGLSQILNKPTIPSAQVSSDWNSVISPTQILNKPSVPQYYHNGASATNAKFLTFSASVAGGAGNAVVYLTDNGLIGGNALYTNVNLVLPLVNDSNVNYTYGYTVSGDKKTLTVNVKATPALNIALLSLTLLGVPANVANGTAVTILVIGN